MGNALVAGDTYGSLDGATNAGLFDIFLMKFDAQGVHLWTRQRGGEDNDIAEALQADWGAKSFVLESFPWRKSFRTLLGGPCSESFGVASPLKWTNLLSALTRSISLIPVSRKVSHASLSDFFRL